MIMKFLTWVNSDRKSAEMFRFCAVGAIVICIDFSAYLLLTQFLLTSVSKTISFIIGGVAAYYLNKFWTFQQSRMSSAEVFRFIAGNGSALVVNVLTNQGTLAVFPGQIILGFGAATVVTTVYTYLVFKFWVFTDKELAP